MLFYTVAVPVVKVIAKIFFPYKVHGNANDIPASQRVGRKRVLSEEIQVCLCR